jgi:hypothetical protein
LNAEALLEFENVVTDAEGRRYTARACGRAREDGLWEGWLEFEPLAGGDVLRGPRETTQPDRSRLAYWARGLTASYLEGGLERARRPTPRRATAAATSAEAAAPSSPPAAPSTAAPSRPRTTREHARAESMVGRRTDRGAGRWTERTAERAAGNAVLDPFAVYAQGEDVLRQELAALAPSHLRHIIRAYDLVGETRTELRSLGHPKLVKMILDGVRTR